MRAAGSSAAGVEFLSPPVEVDDGPFKGFRWYILRDPDRFMVELYRLPEGSSFDDL